jgi:hypothetical protein
MHRVAPAAAAIPWPFDGRVVRVVDTEELPHPWLIRRHHTRDGWGIEGLALAYPPQLIPSILEGMRTLAPGIDEMLREAGDTYSARHARRFTGQRWLGVDTLTPVLSTRPGLLLGDHLLLNTPVITGLRDADTASLTLSPDWLRWWETRLLQELTAGAHQLTGLPWSPDPRGVPVTIPAEFLVQWTLDPATHFACHVASNTMLGDLRLTAAVDTAGRPGSADEAPAPDETIKDPMVLIGVELRRRRRDKEPKPTAGQLRQWFADTYPDLTPPSYEAVRSYIRRNW